MISLLVAQAEFFKFWTHLTNLGKTPWTKGTDLIFTFSCALTKSRVPASKTLTGCTSASADIGVQGRGISQVLVRAHKVLKGVKTLKKQGFQPASAGFVSELAASA